MKRTFPLLAAVISAAILLSGCGAASEPAAAKVGATKILRKTLDDQLAVLADNTKWMTALESEFGDDQLVYPNGGVNSRFTAAWLSSLMNQVVVDEAFERRRLTVSPENRAAAEKAARDLFQTTSGSTFNTLPQWFRDDFVEHQSRYEALKGTLLEPVFSEEELAQGIEQGRTGFCPSGDAVSHILKATREEADAIVAQLAAGADFAELAEESVDTGTAGRGGFITCTGNPNYTQLPEAFRQVVSQVPVGSYSAPFETEFGFHVVKVTPWDLASLRVAIEAIARQQRADPIVQLINNRLLQLKIWVDPRYGSVTPSPVRIQAPTAPSPRSKPEATTAPATAPAGSNGP